MSWLGPVDTATAQKPTLVLLVKVSAWLSNVTDRVHMYSQDFKHFYVVSILIMAD